MKEQEKYTLFDGAKKTAFVYTVATKVIESRLSLPVPDYDNTFVNAKDVFDFIERKKPTLDEETIDWLGLPITINEIGLCLEGLCTTHLLIDCGEKGYCIRAASFIYHYNKLIRKALAENSLVPLEALRTRIRQRGEVACSEF